MQVKKENKGLYVQFLPPTGVQDDLLPLFVNSIWRKTVYASVRSVPIIFMEK